MWVIEITIHVQSESKISFECSQDVADKLDSLIVMAAMSGYKIEQNWSFDFVNNTFVEYDFFKIKNYEFCCGLKLYLKQSKTQRKALRFKRKKLRETKNKLRAIMLEWFPEDSRYLAEIERIVSFSNHTAILEVATESIINDTLPRKR